MKRKIYTALKKRTRLLFVLILAALSAPFMLPAVPVAAAPCELYTSTPVNQIIVPWYKYLEGEEVDLNQDGNPDACRPKLDTGFSDGQQAGSKVTKNVTLIIIAVIELLTRIAGLIAVGYLIYGAFQYILSQGEPEGLKNAKDTITNALAGFVVVMLAIVLVQFLGRALQ